MAQPGWPSPKHQVFHWIQEDHPEAVATLPKQTIWELFPEYESVGPRPAALARLHHEIKTLGEIGESPEFVEFLRTIPFDRRHSFEILNRIQQPNDWSQSYLKMAVVFRGGLAPSLMNYSKVHEKLALQAQPEFISFYSGINEHCREVATYLYIAAVNPSLSGGLSISPMRIDSIIEAYMNFSESVSEL